MHRSRWLAAALLCLVAGCDGLLQPFESPERGRLGRHDPEAVRIFAPVDVIGDREIATVVVERVAHEGDPTTFDPARLRCVVVSLNGAGGFLDERDPSAPLTRVEQADIDRGTRLTLLLTSREPGTGVIRARLLAGRCADGTSDAVLADALRTVRFVITEPFPDAGAAEEDAGEF